MFIKILTLVILQLSIQCYAETPIVYSPLGNVAGELRSTRNGNQFAAFEGIPYAKPPTGERRFEPPEPMEPWQDTWNATTPSVCLQLGVMDFTPMVGDEDCLHLNVYVPGSTIDPNRNLDAIVYIHGGGYMYGSSSFDVYPAHLMEKDIIFVSMNYRLGIFGFLSTEDEIVPGNMGLKDQLQALRWVQQNIKSFGGNPNSVTIIGQSAGAGSVHLHYFSAQSVNLFHRGYSGSGTALNYWNVQKEGLSKVKKLGHILDCDTDKPSEIIECLKRKPAKEILSQLKIFYGFQFFPITPFGPTVEIDHEGAFISENPMALIRKGRIHDRPWLVSMTTDEGYPLAKSLINDLDQMWNQAAPFLLDFNYSLPKSSWNYTAQKIKEFYLGSKQFKGNLQALSDIVSDRFGLVDAESALRLQSNANESPVYYYVFGYPTNSVVSHGSDSKYFFGSSSEKAMSKDDMKMSDSLLNMLVSFAKTGVPKFEGVDWKPVQLHEINYLKVDGFEDGDIKQLTSRDDLTPRKFWKSLRIAEGENLIIEKNEL